MCNNRDVTEHDGVVKEHSVWGGKERHDSNAVFGVFAVPEIPWGALKGLFPGSHSHKFCGNWPEVWPRHQPPVLKKE